MTELQEVYLGIALCFLGLIILAINRGRDAARDERKRLHEKWVVK